MRLPPDPIDAIAKLRTVLSAEPPKLTGHQANLHEQHARNLLVRLESKCAETTETPSYGGWINALRWFEEHYVQYRTRRARAIKRRFKKEITGCLENPIVGDDGRRMIAHLPFNAGYSAIQGFSDAFSLWSQHHTALSALVVMDSYSENREWQRVRRELLQLPHIDLTSSVHTHTDGEHLEFTSRIGNFELPQALTLVPWIRVHTRSPGGLLLNDIRGAAAQYDPDIVFALGLAAGEESSVDLMQTEINDRHTLYQKHLRRPIIVVIDGDESDHPVNFGEVTS